MAYGQKYHFTGFSLKGKPLLVKFKQSGYSGASTEIEAGGDAIQIDYDNLSGDKIKPIIGSRCTFQLIANESFSTLDFYSDDELTWLCEVWIDNALFWQGFIQPGSCQEDFTTDGTRYATIEAVDGLALLSGFAFVQNSGNFFIGQMTPRQIIYSCLIRAYRDGIALHTHSTLYESAMDQSLNPLDQCLFNAERYLNGSTAMKALDVLVSVLKNFGMQIRQVDGIFKAYRIADIVGTGAKKFFRYNADGTANGTVNSTIYSNQVGYGSIQFDGTEALFRPDRPYRNVKVRYEYGYKDGLISNPYINGVAGNALGWTKSTGFNGSITTGVEFNGDDVSEGTNNVQWDPLPIEAGTKLNVKMTFTNTGYVTSARYRVKLGTYYLQSDGSWSTTVAYVGVANFVRNPLWSKDGDPSIPQFVAANAYKDYTLETQVTPVEGNLEIGLYEGDIINSNDSSHRSGTVWYTYFNIYNVQQDNENQATGEYYIANNPGDYRLEPETVNVFNADDTSAIYLGTIYRADGITPTVSWSSALISNKPLLSIIAEEILRMYHKPFGIVEGEVDTLLPPLFTGDIYGNGKCYLAVGMQYDVVRNTTRVTFVELSNAAIPDFTSVKIENDYGQYESTNSGGGGGGIAGGGSSAADYLTETEADDKYYPLGSNPAGYLTTVPPHTQAISTITGLQAALDSKPTGAANDWIKNTATLQAGSQYHVAKGRVTTELYIPAVGFAAGQKVRIKASLSAGSGGEVPPPPLTSVAWGDITGSLSAQTDLAAVLNGYFAKQQNVDLDTRKTSGWVTVVGGHASNPFAGTGSSGFASFESTNWGWQLIGSDGGAFNLKGRILSNSTWGSWYTLWHSGNLTPSDYLDTLQSVTNRGGSTTADVSFSGGFKLVGTNFYLSSGTGGAGAYNAFIGYKADGTLTIGAEVDSEPWVNTLPISFKVGTVAKGRYEAMRLTNTGTLLIGTTTDAPNSKLVTSDVLLAGSAVDLQVANSMRLAGTIIMHEQANYLNQGAFEFNSGGLDISAFKAGVSGRSINMLSPTCFNPAYNSASVDTANGGVLIGRNGSGVYITGRSAGGVDNFVIRNYVAGGYQLDLNLGGANINGQVTASVIVATGNMLSSGNVTFANSLQVKDGNGTWDVIKKFGSDANGAGIAIGSGSCVIVGAGESASVASANITHSTEQLVLTSDNGIDFYTNMQSGWASRKTAMVLGANGGVTVPIALYIPTSGLPAGQKVRIKFKAAA